MATRIFSLHIGVSKVDTNHYGDALTNLPCCKVDAEYMFRMGKLFDYDHQELLINENATVDNVKNTLLEFSQQLKKDDLCVITYSGHGGTLPDLNNSKFDPELEDQTWCLYDRQLVDDELPYIWKEFDPGVNIFVLLDS
ncbi:MAG: caspase family protein, partial [Bacteroidota bacterium]